MGLIETPPQGKARRHRLSFFLPPRGRGGRAAAPWALLDALDEPAAVVVVDGRVLAANRPWREGPMAGPRLPQGLPGLFAALAGARAEGRAEAVLALGRPRRLGVTALEGDRLLLRLFEASEPGPSAMAPAAAPPALAGAEPRAAGGPLDPARAPSPLDQRSKMEAIGQLAGGVAHDFNNLLTAIRLRVDELLVRHSLGDPSHESLTEIRQTVDRSAEMVRQLLTFSRKATVRRETLDLAEVIGDLEVLLRRLLREDVRLQTDLGAGLPPVRADRGQIENAVMNLVVNARDALAGAAGRAREGGVIRLAVRRVEGAEAAGLGGPAEGDWAMIEVADNGPGIPPEHLGSLFEPFFTTKAVGEGTGLGLATVYGVARQAEGTVVVRSEPGEGAIFRMFLPAWTPPLQMETPAPAAARPQPRDLSGAGRILFVEDEPLVRGVAARLLRARGYEVIEAADGEAALDLARRHAGAIDLMISDVIMPGMDGPALLRAAREPLAGAPVIFISGYAEAEFSDLLEGEAGVSFVPKPLDIMNLAAEVKRRLSAG